jgi:CheY-like chemotaxis protein
MLAKVFDPFFTTKPVGKGTGLGLSQVHGFVHQAGGTVKVESKLNEGTAVSMYFPRARLAHVPDLPHPDAMAAGAGNVLLVEDNPDVASASTVLLEQLGYAVRWAPDADSALRELEGNGIDLVFSDIVMPGTMDGIGLARAIRDKYPNMPIVLATGYSERLHDLQGDFPVIRKPYQIHELSQMLSNLR